MTHRIANWIGGLVMGIVLAACGPDAPPPPPDPTVAQVNVTGAADQNPDGNGRASPAIVYVYALKPGNQFETGDSEALLGGDLGDLGETVTRLTKLTIFPGKGDKQVFELGDGFTDIGITVNYRNFAQSQWRVKAPVKANDVTLIKATIGANAVTVQ